MSMHIFYIMGSIMAVSVVAMSYVMIHAIRQLVTMSRSTIMHNDRERLDQDRIMMQHIEKLHADDEQKMRLAQLHANEAHKKWFLSQSGDQLSEGEKKIRQEVLDAMAEQYGNGYGPRQEAQPFDLGSR